MRSYFINKLNYCFFILLLMANGCGVGLKTIVPPPHRNPIQVDNEELPKIFVGKIKSSLLPGQIIGGHFDGFAKIRQYNYYAHGTIEYWAEEKYKEIIYSELSNAGYNIPDYSTLFGESEKYNVRFIVGGTLTNFIRQSFGPNAGNFTEDFLEIEWELFDRILNKTIFRFKTHGFGKVDGVTIESSLIAFRNSFRNLLSEMSFVEILRKNKPQPIKTRDHTEVYYYDKLSGRDTNYFNLNKYLEAVFAIKTESGHGSGFIINPEGFALTCYHLIENRSSLDAIFSDGKTIKVDVVSFYPEIDLALLKLTGSNYPFLALASKDEIKMSEDVYSVGTPLDLNLSQTVAKGIISGMRVINNINFIQTDASINPGNSGGPLILMNGKVVGVIALKLSGFEIEGLGFAISIDEVINKLNLKKK